MSVLEDTLVDLADHLDVPAADDLAAAVGRRLRSGDGSAWAPARPAAWRRTIVLVPVGLAALLGGLAAAPAVADWFGVRGVEITRREPSPSTTARELVAGHDLDLGDPTSLARASEVTGFEPVVPAALGPPDAVWVDRRPTVPFVSLVYGDGTLVNEFDATLATGAIVSKFATAATTIEQLTIDGEPAMWIEGVHEVVLRAKDGRFVAEPLRTSDRVLLVQHGKLTVRIETAAGRDEAIRIAESLP